jgi:hypothetical protein
MSFEALVCASLPDTTLPFMNAFFLSQEDALRLGLGDRDHLLVEAKLGDYETVVYPAKAHRDVLKGQIVLNKQQRGVLNISMADKVYIRPFEHQTQKVNFNLAQLNIVLNLMTNAKTVVEEDEVAEFVLKRFEGFVR